MANPTQKPSLPIIENPTILQPVDIQLASLLENIELYTQVISSFIAKHPELTLQIRNLLLHSLKQSYCIFHFFPQAEHTQEKLALFEAIHNLARMTNHLKIYVPLILHEAFLLTPSYIETVNNKIKHSLHKLEVSNINTINFNKLYNEVEGNLLKIELLSLLNIGNFVPESTYQILDYMFNDPKLIQTFRKLSLQNNKLYLVPLRRMILSSNNNMESLYYYLNLVVGILRDEENYKESENGEIIFKIKKINLELKRIYFFDQIYDILLEENIEEYEEIFDQYIDYNRENIEFRFEAFIECKWHLDLWLKLSTQTGINKYELLFNPMYNRLFEKAHLVEIDQILNSEKLNDNYISYFTKGTEEYELYQILLENSSNSTIITNFEKKAVEAEKFIKSKLRCEDIDTIPNSSSPLKKAKIFHLSK